MRNADLPKTNADSPKTFAFWRNLFLYFYVFSLLGHVLEVTYSAFQAAILNGHPFYPIMPSMVPLSPPYGIGAVLLVVMAAPIVDSVRQHLKPIKQRWLAGLAVMLTAFVVSAVLMTLTEIISGLFCVAIWGYNPFWQYSGPGAFLNGLIYVPNCMLFGLAGMIVVLLMVNPMQRFLARSNQRTLTVVFWILLITYAADLAWTAPQLAV